MKLVILRRKSAEDTPYWESFDYAPQSAGDTVATALTWLNLQAPMRNSDGQATTAIRWQCSCLQKKCGACAMVVNGRPMLACAANLAALGDVVKVEPLRKFPLVADLIVDRSILFENLKTIGAWLTEDADFPDGKRTLAYQASTCLQCGCCLEICPNYYVGGSFFGMAAMPIATRLLSAEDKEARKSIVKEYNRHVYAGCGKSMACRDVCPAKLDTQEVLAASNAMAVWRRR